MVSLLAATSVIADVRRHDRIHESVRNFGETDCQKRNVPTALDVFAIVDSFRNGVVCRDIDAVFSICDNVVHLSCC